MLVRSLDLARISPGYSNIRTYTEMSQSQNVRPLVRAFSMTQVYILHSEEECRGLMLMSWIISNLLELETFI